MSTPLTTAPQVASAAPPRRRFRAVDVPTHLDMGVIGEVCLGVTLTGYHSVVRGFLDDPAGSLASLLQALDENNTTTLSARAHAVKGGAASLGLRSVQALASSLEAATAGETSDERAAAAANLRELVVTARSLLQRMGLL